MTFTSAAALHAWLDSPDRSQLLAEAGAGGFPRISSDVIVDADSSSTGVSVFRHTVTTGDEADFVRAQTELVRLSAAFSGFEGATLLRPARSGGDWLSVLRFRTDRQLQAWVDSAERRAALPDLRSHLAEDFTVVTSRAPFGSILRTQDGTTRVTPEWKTAMLVLLVLYPTVMTLSRFLGPVLDDAGAQPWLSMWLSQIVSVALMTWLLMPWIDRTVPPMAGPGGRRGCAGQSDRGRRRRRRLCGDADDLRLGEVVAVLGLPGLTRRGTETASNEPFEDHGRPGDRSSSRRHIPGLLRGVGRVEV